METDSDTCTLSFLNEQQEKINTRSDYQRPEVWKRAQKQLLIDSILRGYDIPKIYVKQEDSSSQYEFEVIDGQQRLVAIWEFFDGKFALPKDAKAISGIKCASQNYEDLDIKLQKHLNKYEVDFVVVTEAVRNEDKDEIGDLFLRLQNGTPLNNQEKRNAMPGKMRDFIKKLAGSEDLPENKGKKEGHKFFESTAIKDSRYSYDQLAAQLTLLELSLGESKPPPSVSSGDLDKMYETENNFDETRSTATKVKKTLDYLYRTFPSKNSDLVQHSVITLYCLSSKLLKNYVSDGTENLLRDWFEAFEEERKEEEKLDSEKKNPTLLEYKNRIAGNTNDHSKIKKRLEIMEERFFAFAPDILLKDDDRFFSHEQRLAIFRRDKETCQICNNKIKWTDYEADHILPHSKGGETKVSNGQATCKSCNASKSNKQ